MRFALTLLGVFGIAQGATRTSELVQKLPLRFEGNNGRDSHRETAFVARGSNFRLSLAPSQSWLEWAGSDRGRSAVLHTSFRGANHDARIEPEQKLPGIANYFLGSAEKWRTAITGFGRLRQREVYPGVDVVFHGEDGRLEYDFILAPQADPEAIRLDLDGQRDLHIGAQGDLVISTDAGEIRWKSPEIYQEIDGRRQQIHGGFAIEGQRTVHFALGKYDRNRTLVIDPVLKYSTYIGGENNEAARGVALDALGNIYIAGVSSSPDLPTTGSAYQANFAGRTALASGVFSGDGFVAKFSPTGALLYLTYLGGSRDDGIAALAVDAAGNAYVTGATNSLDFPVVNAFQSHFGGLSGNQIAGDAFVAKLSPDGSKLVFSTYLGGGLDDIGTGIALDKSGNIFICGASASLNFPLLNPLPKGGRQDGTGGEPIRHFYDTVPEWEPGDGIVAEFDPNGNLLFSTYLGGLQDDAALSIAVDSSSNVYVGGCTLSFNFPTTTGAFQTAYKGQEAQNAFFHMGDGFVTKINPGNSSIVYSTFFGGTGDDCITSIAIDSAGAVYMTGTTSSRDLHTAPGALQTSYAGYKILPFAIAQLFGDAFVAKLDPTGAKLQYLTYLGGSQNDGGTGIAVDNQGNAYVLGFTDSRDFPLAGAPMQPQLAGDGGVGLYLFYGDAFLAIVNPTGTTLVYSSYFGGNLDERPFGMALDPNGNVYLTGNTVSTNFPTTANSLQPKYGGFKGHANGTPRGDAFLSVLSGFSASPPTITSVTNAYGDSPVIAPNTWVAIKGSNLSATPPRIWQDSDFTAFNGQLPTSLDGVGVTLNGKKAYVYFISAAQINILTPPDLPAGPIQVQVTSGGLTSPIFNSQAQAESISLFVFNGGPYVIAVHLDGTIVGPASLYPGQSSPAKPGENIVVFANGFGPTDTPIVPGSAVQSGNLGSPPPMEIGGQPVNVGFAGLVSPGLFQFNVTVPPNLPDGDAKISIAYAGQVTQSGTLITIQH